MLLFRRICRSVRAVWPIPVGRNNLDDARRLRPLLEFRNRIPLYRANLPIICAGVHLLNFAQIQFAECAHPREPLSASIRKRTKLLNAVRRCVLFFSVLFLFAGPCEEFK